MRKRPAEERFWEKVRKSDGCWEWLAYKNSDGYGTFRVDGRMVLAHRWAYEHLVGPIPPELECDHRCRNRACVNPAHLQLVSHKENVLRGVGPAAQHARKTVCKNGHPLIATGARRRCLTCDSERRVVNREQRNAQTRARYAAKRVGRTT